MRTKRVTFGLLLSSIAVVVPATAGILYTGGNGTTVYGVTSYGAPQPGVPTFIGNNFTNNPDILSSPGGTFLTANPVVANNIAQAGPGATPFNSAQVGGGNVNGAFGAGSAAVSGPGIGFSLSDTAPGGGSASYMITSWNSNFTVDAAGFAGTLGAFLAIQGHNNAPADSSVASLVTYWSLNGGGFVRIPDLILAANGFGPGNGQQDVALGGSGAAILSNGLGDFRGLAIDNLGFFNLAPGATISVRSTLTAYADPSSFDDIFEIDPGLLDAAGGNLPNFAFAEAAAPEPGTLIFAAAGLLGLVTFRKYSKT